MASGRVLLTGGAGYIGSHTAVELLHAGWAVVVVDNLANAKAVVIDRIRALAPGDVELHIVDLLDADGLDRVFAAAPIDAVVHFGGLKAVGESTEEPLRYYENNVAGTVSLLKVMAAHELHDLVFSSSCTVYGDPIHLPVDEDHPRSATNPYGRTKLMIEEILEDIAAADPRWRIAMLRYFNPVGAHPSGTIGEDPTGVPNNLMPFAMQVAVGRRPHVRVFGNDYPTPDGTGVRDYIHVVDLALGHLAALEALPRVTGCEPVNLGTGHGSSVLDVIDAASAAVGAPIPYEIVDRRPGDIAATWADASRAASFLGWKATRSLADMCADHWRWQSSNPDGYPA